MIHVCGIGIKDAKIKLDKKYLEGNNIHIPEGTTFDDGTLSFSGEYEAKKWIRTHANEIPYEIKTIHLYSTFIDNLSDGKRKWQQKGNILRCTITLTELRDMQVQHQPSKKKKYEYDDEDDESEDDDREPSEETEWEDFE